MANTRITNLERSTIDCLLKLHPHKFRTGPDRSVAVRVPVHGWSEIVTHDGRWDAEDVREANRAIN